MDKKYGGSFKKPRSLLGRRSQRFSLTGNTDSRLESISESATPTPSTSRQDTTITADESLPLGYDSICDETLRTPLSHKFSSHDYSKTPTTYTTNLRLPMGFTDSHKKTSRFARPEHAAQKSVSLQTSRELDIMGTPPHVLRRRLNITSSAFTDLEEEYSHLQQFTTLEKQVLSVEGMNELQNENTKLKVEAYHLLEEAKTLKEKIAFLENNSNVAELEEEVAMLKNQVHSLTDEATSLKGKLQEITSENNVAELEAEVAMLKNQVYSLTLEATSLKGKQEEITSEKNVAELEEEVAMLKNQVHSLTDEATSLKVKLQEITSENNVEELEAEVAMLKNQVHSLTDEATSLKEKLQEMTSENKKLSAKFDLTNHKLIDLEMVSEAKESQWCRREDELTKSLQEAWNLLENSGVNKDSINSSDKPFTCDIEKYNLLQDTLKEKINILNSLQSDIASTQLSFVSELDNKNLQITSLAEKAKTKFEQIIKECEEKYDQELKAVNSVIETNAKDLQVKDELINKITNECNTYEAERKEYESKIKTLELNLSEIAETIETKNEKIKELKEKLDSCNCNVVINEKKLHINTIREYLSSLGCEMSPAHHDVIINSYDDIIPCLTTKVSSFINYNEQLKNEILSKEDQLKEITNRYDVLKEQISNADNKTKELVEMMNEQQSFFSTISYYLSSIDSDTCPINNYDDIICCLRNKFSSNYDLNEHLRDKIESKEDQLKELTNSCDIMKEQIIEADNKIKELQENLNMCQCSLLVKEQQSFFNNVKEYLSCISSDIYPINNYSDIMTYLETTFSSNYDLNEHLRNKIESKENKLKEMTNICNAMKKQIAKSDAQTEELKNTIKSKEEQLQVIVGICNYLKNELKNSYKGLSELETNLLTTAEEIDRLNQREEESKTTIGNLLVNISELKYELEHCSDDFSHFKHSMESQMSEIQDLKEHLENKLQSRNDKIIKITQELKQLKSNCMSKEESYANELSFKNSEIEKLKASEKHLIECNSHFEDQIAGIKEEVGVKGECDRTDCDRIKALELTLTEAMSAVETKNYELKELQRKLDMCQCDLVIHEKQTFFNSLSDYLSTFDCDVSPITNYNEIICYLQNKFSSSNDLNEHLKNKIKSKEDQLEEILSSYIVLKSELVDSRDELRQLHTKFQESEEKVSLLKEKEEGDKILIEQFKESITDLNCKLSVCSDNFFIYKQNVESKISELEDLKDHFGNKLQSKSDQIMKISQEYQHLKETSLLNENRLSEELSIKITDIETLKASEKHLTECISNLKNQISELEEALGSKNCELKIACDTNEYVSEIKSSELNLIETVTNAENKNEVIKNWHEKLEMCCCDLIKNEQQAFFKTVKDFFSSFETDEYSISNYDDIISILSNRFSSNYDLNELLRDKIESKDDQLKEITNSFDMLKVQLVETENKHKDLQKRLDMCCCSQITNEQYLFFNEIENHLSNIDCCHCPINKYEDVINCLKNKIHYIIDLNEHLRNKIKSKEDQLNEILLSFSVQKHELEDSRKEVSELESQLHKTEEELFLLRQSQNEEKEMGIKQVQDEIRLLNDDLKLSLDNFSQFKQNMILKISELEDLKEHLYNKLQSKSDKILKITQELKLFKEKGLSEEKRFIEELSFKDDEIQSLKASEKQLTECISNLENKISQLEELNLKNNEYKSVGRDIEYESQIRALELNLSETVTTIECKNEVIKELLEKLEVCRCEVVIKEQQLFFNSIRDHLSRIDTEAYLINNYEDIISIFKNKLSSICDLNEHLRNKIESKEDQVKEISNTCDNMKEQITAADSKIKELQEKLGSCSCNVMINELNSFFGTLSDYLSSIDSDMSPLNNYNDIVCYLKNKFSAYNDLNEHLRNKIKSKEEKLKEILNNFNVLKSELDEAHKELSELQTKQCYSENELCLSKQREEDKESRIKQLLEQIRQLDLKLELSSNNFSCYEQCMGSKISELEDLKEHLENKLQSKSEKLIKVNQEYQFLKEIGLSNEKRFAEDLSLKMNEIEVLKTSEKHLFERISNLENQIVKLEEEVDLKNNECKDVISKLEHLSRSFEEKNKSNLNEDLSSLEKQLSEAFKELDSYKTNEVNKDNDIIKLELQVSELNSSLASKTKEINNHNENMDRLSQNIVELIQDKESFFDKLKNLISFTNFKTFDDVLEIVKSNHLELTTLKNNASNNFHSNDELIGQLETLRTEFNFLKKEYEKAIFEFEEYKAENPRELVTSIRECDIIVTDMLAILSSNQPDMDFSSLCTKDKINKMNGFINELLIKSQCLEKELENQVFNNSVNMDFVEKINSDIFTRIESTNQVINDLCLDVSMYKVQFDEQIALKDSEIENLQKEVGLSLMDVKELVTVSEKQNNDILCLTNAYLNLQTDYESLIDNCKTSVKSLYESDNDLLNEYVSISQDLLAAIHELMNSNYLSTPLFVLKRDVFSYYETLILNFSDEFTEVIDKLCLDFINNIKSLKVEHENIADECDLTSSVVCDLKSFKLEPCSFVSLVRPYDTEFEELTHGENLFELIDSIARENKMLDLANSTQKQLLLENLELIKNRVNKQNFQHTTNNIPYNMNIGGNADVSLLMSVVDETVLENVDSSVISVDKNYTLSGSFASPCPEKTQYILPEGHINTSDVQLEKTLYLPNRVGNTSSSDDDPLKVIDKTIGSGFTNAWLHFDNKLNRNCLDESGAEFHDAQDSAEEIDPVPNEVEENLLINISSDLKKILRIQSVEDMEILVEVKAIIASIESVKTCVMENYPDISDEKVDTIVRVLLDKISLLEKDKLSLYEKYHNLYLSLSSAQKSIEELKKIKLLISSDLEKTQKHVFNQTSVISKHLERSHDIILAQDKVTASDIECLRRDQETLKNSYNACLNELQCALKTNNDLEKFLEEYKELLKDSSSKYEELMTEQNCLKMEFEKVNRDYSNVREVAKELKDHLESKNNETISLNNQIMNLQSNIASSEKHMNDNDTKIKLLILENTNLLSEVVSLKSQIESSRDLNVKFEKQSSELSSLEFAYNLLKTNHDDLLNKFCDAQKIVESIDKGEHKSLLNNNDVVEGLRNILRALDFDDDFDLRDNIVHTLSKIQRRISLLLEHHSDVGVASSSHEINDLNQKIRSLESDLYDASSFKLSFTKELRSLKPELKLNDLLKRPLNELHTLMITEIMSRENSIISNLKSEYENKIMSLKDELHQLIEKDKRRMEWVSEVESDNDQLNSMTKKLKEDISSATEKLESKILCENHILIELKKLDQKMNDDLSEDSQMSSQEVDLDTLKKSEVTGEILVKLQKIVKNYLPSDESACYNIDKYKEMIKTLEVKCLDLQNQVIELEQHHVDSNNEIIELKSSLTDKTESLRTLENTLCVVKEKLNFAEEKSKQEQEQLQREKAFSLKTLEENKYSKKLLEEHIQHLHKINIELNDAKETIRSTISKHEKEISSLMKVITDLECELKLSRRTEEEKGSIESELFQANRKLNDLKQEFSSQIIDLENENKTLKNEMNMKLKEFSLLKEEHEHEIKFLKSSLNDNININSSLKNTNENLISKISMLESDLSEKEALYRDSVAKLMRERENNMEKIKTLEEFTTDSSKEILELENKLSEFDKMYNLLMSDFNKKEINYKERVQEMECLVENLRKKIELIENNLVQKEKAHIIEVNDLNVKINGYLERISQFDKCLSDSKESEKGFNADLLKLFPECSSCSTELLSHIKSKLAEITALKEELEDKTSECRYLEEDYDQMILLVEDLRRRIGEVCRAQFEDETKYKSLLGEKDAEIEKLQSLVSKQSDVEWNNIKVKEDIITTLEQNNNILKNRLKETEVSIANLTEENTALRKQISQKPPGCKECKQIMDQVIHFKAKLSVKEVKIAELTSKIMDMDTQRKESLKENDATLKTYMDKIDELEKEKVRLTAQVKTEHPSVSLLKDINNQQPADLQASKISKLESRIAKLEKDREFLKRLCEKRATVINELKHELDSNKK